MAPLLVLLMCLGDMRLGLEPNSGQWFTVFSLMDLHAQLYRFQ